MAQDTGVVAIGLLTAEQVALLGDGLRRSWPVDDAPHFAELLRAIDDADAAAAERRTGVASPTPE